jgi:D-amino peptidase
MRVYISIDAEGCSGIYKLAQVDPANPDYPLCRHAMEEDANAAIRGAFAAGATEVAVNDAHNRGDNIRIDNLDPRALLISGSDRPHSMMEGISSAFDAALLLGYHSRKGTEGVISHTYYYGSVVEVRVNGKPVAEYEINGLMAGHCGVPVVFLSGDDCVTEDAKANIPGVAAVATKRAIGCGAACCVHPSLVRPQIEEKVRDVLISLKTTPIEPMSAGSAIALEIRFATHGHGAMAALMPGAQRTDPVTLRYESGNFGSAFQAFLCMLNLAACFKERE